MLFIIIVMFLCSLKVLLFIIVLFFLRFEVIIMRFFWCLFSCMKWGCVMSVGLLFVGFFVVGLVCVGLGFGGLRMNIEFL